MYSATRRNTWITQVKLGGGPPIAKCNSPLLLSATAGGCTTTLTKASLIAQIDAGSLSPGSPLKLDLQPGPDFSNAAMTYLLSAGHTYTFTLVAANSAGEESP